MNTKPIVVFTNFFDAKYVIESGILLFKDNEDNDNNIKKFIMEKGNVTMLSIALSKPTNLGCERLDFFCPTYEMLKRYKNDKNWDNYKKDYNNLLKKRRNEIGRWLMGLKNKHLYFLCCWENTINGANCHRQLIYDAMCKSKTALDKVIPIYRHGEKSLDKMKFSYFDDSPVLVSNGATYRDVVRSTINGDIF